jgi:hypothetical protein
MRRFAENDRVTLINLGSSHSDREYRAIIKGLSVEDTVPAARVWIVEMVDKLEPQTYGYSHCTMPESCIRPGWKEC